MFVVVDTNGNVYLCTPLYEKAEIFLELFHRENQAGPTAFLHWVCGAQKIEVGVKQKGVPARFWGRYGVEEFIEKVVSQLDPVDQLAHHALRGDYSARDAIKDAVRRGG